MKYYRVVSADSFDKLESLVDGLISSGWKCQGGVCVTLHGGKFLYSQAIIAR